MQMVSDQFTIQILYNLMTLSIISLCKAMKKSKHVASSIF
jgi:hypothetical protein